MRSLLPAVLLVLTACSTGSTTTPAPKRTIAPDAVLQWTKLPTEPFRGKQDDIFFVSPAVGWYVNGTGKIYKTTDGGATWTKQLDKPGTYFRCIAFLDEKRGFAGTIGTEYYPNVTDTTPLYETRDGGATWTAVTNITGPAVKGLCAIWTKGRNVWAAGRVGGPAFLMTSNDGGETWQSVDLSSQTAMILDILFFDDRNGVLCGATAAHSAQSHALILTTSDGGRTWTKRYESERLFEITWKASFPTRNTGYVTIQNYNPDKAVSQRYVAKSTDGGITWSEVPLVNEHAVREFGIGFADERTGWVGTTTGGYETRDGGATWKAVEMGKAVNKIRVLDGSVAYAIGVDVYKLVIP
jgi:photosystem II stability/assembly factor-like uncharacterized protein